jgi:phosphatidylinositol alpha-mannosyltransferase
MKIALVSPYDLAHPSGVNNHISHLEQAFTGMGHQVRVIAPSSHPHLDEKDNVIAVGRPFPIPASGSICRITLSPNLSGRVKAILAEEKFDIIHIHEPLLPALPVTVLRHSDSITVGTFHAHRAKSWGYYYFRAILKRYFRRLHGKIAVSKPAMEFASRYFRGYYNIIPNGIDLEHFSAPVTPIEEYCDGKLNILFVSRLEKRKGLDYLLKAFCQVKRDFPNSRLIVVGPGVRLREGYDRFIMQAGLKDVVFAGYVNYNDLPRYYHTADVFCAPATGQESFGIILLEAMTTAKPIVASNIEGYASVLTHGAEGLLVPPRDEQTLATALCQLLADKELRQRMGATGRETAKQYSWERVARRIMDYYQRLLSETPPRQSSA